MFVHCSGGIRYKDILEIAMEISQSLLGLLEVVSDLIH